jgi:hypothetical protein
MVERKKLLGVAVGVGLAISAVTAPVATALKFTAASYPVTVNGTQSTSHKLTIGGSTITCTTATATGTLTEAKESLSVIPTYSGCTAFGFLTVSITGFGSTGCSFALHAGGTSSLSCVSGDVQVDAGPCTATFTPLRNQNLQLHTYTNNSPSPGLLTDDTNVTNLHGEITESEFGCPVAEGTYARSAYAGATVFKGADAAGRPAAIDVG